MQLGFGYHIPQPGIARLQAKQLIMDCSDAAYRLRPRLNRRAAGAVAWLADVVADQPGEAVAAADLVILCDHWDS